MSTASSRTSASCVSFPAHGLPLYSPSNTCFRRLSAKLPNAPMFHLSQPVFPGGCARRPTLPPPSSPPTCPRHLVVLLPEMLVVRGLISAVKNEQPFIGREFAKGLARKSCPLPSLPAPPPSPSPPSPSPSPPSPPPSSPPPSSPPTCPRHLVVLLPEMLVVRGLISAVKNEQPFIGREFAKGLARKSCPLPSLPAPPPSPSPPSPSPPPPPSSPPPSSPPPSLPREGVSKMAACANV